MFQSTPSRRGRPLACKKSKAMAIVSIHALAKRATPPNVKREAQFFVSIHALAKRATNARASFLSLAKSFNPRPREEGDTFTFHFNTFLYTVALLS